MTKYSDWKQLNPFDQLQVLLMAIEGNLSNIKDCIYVEKSILDAQKFLNQIKQLEPFLKKGSW